MPKILTKKLQHKSQIFEIYDLKLQFDNGVQVDYEVLYDKTIWTAMIVALDEKQNVFLVREYQAAINEYQLCLPKGGVNYQSDPNQRSAKEAANIELQEEVGVKSQNLISLAKLTSSPGSINHATEIFLATDLIPGRKIGDEPEELEVVVYPLRDFEQLIDRGELTESRAIAALYLARRYLRQIKNMKLH